MPYLFDALYICTEGVRAYLLIEDLLNLEMHCEYLAVRVSVRACLLLISTNNEKGRTSHRDDRYVLQYKDRH
jgi:hypothetical protein